MLFPLLSVHVVLFLVAKGMSCYPQCTASVNFSCEEWPWADSVTLKWMCNGMKWAGFHRNVLSLRDHELMNLTLPQLSVARSPGAQHQSCCLRRKDEVWHYLSITQTLTNCEISHMWKSKVLSVECYSGLWCSLSSWLNRWIHMSHRKHMLRHSCTTLFIPLSFMKPETQAQFDQVPKIKFGVDWYSNSDHVKIE